MNLRPIESHEFERVAAWLQDPDIARWLDFGAGRRSVDALGLKIMSQRDLHCLRVFSANRESGPVGLVGLSNVDREFRTAELWFVLGEKTYRRRDLTAQAVERILQHGFDALELASVFAWTLEVNAGGRRILERMGFREIGRRRRCHRLDGRLHDRLLFDLLAEEYRGRREEEAAAARSSAGEEP